MKTLSLTKVCCCAVVLFLVALLLPAVGLAQGGQIIVIEAAKHSVTPELRHIPPRLPEHAMDLLPLLETGPAVSGGGGATPNGNSGKGNGGGGATLDPDLQTTHPTALPAPIVGSFPGIPKNQGSPADPNLAVGATQVVHIVNVQFKVYDKSGGLQLGPVQISTLFSPLGASSPCVIANGGDPTVLYDQLASRWLISQLEYPRTFPDGTSNYETSNHVCIAVSKTPDAMGEYNLYDYDWGTSDLPDYPKFGVWLDAYYFSSNTFRNNVFVGARPCAFNRSAMLAGTNAVAVCFQQSTATHSLLPSGLDGTTGPPTGSPNYYLQMDSGLSLFKFHVDFANTANSTFTGPTSISVGRFVSPPSGGVIPQPEVSDKLETLGDRLMYRLSYRNFGTYESLLVTHTVQVTQSGASGTQTGLRWYEIRNPNGTGRNNPPVIYQQSTFSPDSTTYRWMGSIAQDRLGNMLLGYSASSSTLFPSIRYTGRLSTDPLNQMESEAEILRGTGSQVLGTGATRDRWGDYTSVAVDPVDDCTLWFVSEFVPATGLAWETHLASFQFPTCH